MGSSTIAQLSPSCTHVLAEASTVASLFSGTALHVPGTVIGTSEVALESSGKYSKVYAKVVMPHWISPTSSTSYTLFAGLITTIELQFYLDQGGSTAGIVCCDVSEDAGLSLHWI